MVNVPPSDEPAVDLSLPLRTAEILHAALEDLIEGGRCDLNDGAAPEQAHLKEAYRILAWRILAIKGGTGLTGQMAELARRAESVEEYEATRDKALGPILDGLESAANRDP